MVESVIHLLFLINFICHCQLNLTEDFLHEQDVDHDIAGPHLQSIFNPHNFEDLLLRFADPLDHIENS